MGKIRVGFGYDVHQLQSDLPLWIGGIQIPSSKGAVGHSDADVLIHVICDALLGAANLRNIGFHFSDKDPGYKGIDSKLLLHKVWKMVADIGYTIGNIDTTVCLQEPKLNAHIPNMKTAIAQVLQIAEDDISIKATTSEMMGFVGRTEGIAAYAVALLERQ